MQDDEDVGDADSTVPPIPPVDTNIKYRYVKPEIDRVRNHKRRKCLVDTRDVDSTSRNVILPLNSLLTFIADNFCCRHCRTVLSTTDEETPLRLEIIGIASGLHFNCSNKSCPASGSLRPDLASDATIKTAKLTEGTPFYNRVNAGDLQLNRRFVMGMQLCGIGRHDGTILAGMLDVNVSAMINRWTAIQDIVGAAIETVGREVLEENLYIECQLSPVGAGGRSALAIASDTRWDKRGSGRKYDSLSGCSVALGLRSQLVLELEPMSSICSSCARGVEHQDNLCPKNYDGSAKGMEACGAARIAERLFANEECKCYIAFLVTDDDASVRKVLTHSFKDMVAAGMMTDAEWPRYGTTGKGKKKPDNGLLNILHVLIIFFADKGHRVRGYIRVLFTESYKSAADGCGCTKIDAERMKRRMSWTLRLHCGGTYAEFKTAVHAVLEHHFNNHEYCGDWCKAAEGTAEELVENRLRFRCKTKDAKLYLFMKKHHEQFMEDTKLRQLFHQWDTNAVEGFNKFLTKFLPKDRTFCKTNENKRRALLAAALQSIGYRQFYKRVFQLTGIKLLEEDMTNLFLRSEDAGKLWRRAHRRKQTVKIKRMRMHYKKLRDGVAKLKKDNRKDLSYGSGMMGPGAAGEVEVRQKTCKCGSTQHFRTTHKDCPMRGEQPQQQQQQKARKKPSTCKCGSTMHLRTTHKDCPQNPKKSTTTMPDPNTGVTPQGK